MLHLKITPNCSCLRTFFCKRSGWMNVMFNVWSRRSLILVFFSNTVQRKRQRNILQCNLWKLAPCFSLVVVSWKFKKTDIDEMTFPQTLLSFILICIQNIKNVCILLGFLTLLDNSIWKIFICIFLCLFVWIACFLVTYSSILNVQEWTLWEIKLEKLKTNDKFKKVLHIFNYFFGLNYKDIFKNS